MNFQSRLKKLRLDRKLTQQDIANKLGITRQAYGYYENPKSKREPDIDSIQKLADIFEVTTDFLISGVDISSLKEMAVKKPIDDKKYIQRTGRGSRLTDKDEKDIAKRMEEIKKDLTSEDGLLFHGEPMSDEARESFLEAMEYAFRQTQRINKKYIPKKHREDKDN